MTNQMKATKKVTIEEILQPDAGEPLHIEGIVIAGKTYLLDITNHTRENDKESLHLNFNDGEYSITITPEGIEFDRHTYRPNHDHDDRESLQIKIEDTKEETTLWRTRFPYQGEEYKHFTIPFGSRTIDC